MRDLLFFDRKADYDDHLRNGVLAEVASWECPFYDNLIQFVLDNRAPIFYRISDPSEHFAFSGAYHFETMRERYPNKVREALFWMHDFTHLLFPYRHDLYDISERRFLQEFWYQERLASTETEILAYFRVPGLRERVFPDEKLWYDVLVERGWSKPDPFEFLGYRIDVQMNDVIGEAELGDHPEILQWVQSWRNLTPKWVGQRYRSMAGIRMPAIQSVRLNASNYEDAIGNYVSSATQDDYERQTMHNVHMAFAILGWDDPPQRWRHVPDAFDQLEGAVFFQ